MKQMSKYLPRLGAALLLAGTAAGCGMEKQDAPALAGPSEFGTSITLTATPDTIIQDGNSQATIGVTVVDVNRRPVSGLQLLFSAEASVPLPQDPTFTAQSVVTDANGRAVTQLVAPPPPARALQVNPVVTVFAIPVGSSFANQAERAIQVQLLPPAGTPPPLRNNDPIAEFSMAPGRAILGEAVQFNAQNTTDEGNRCLNRCTYKWDFGDGTSGTGMIVSHQYAFVGPMVVTLTVTDEVGGVGVAQEDLDVYANTGLRAIWVVNPTSPTAGNSATFDASSSRTDVGSVISNYRWDFGDGSAVESTNVPTMQHTFARSGRYTVTLTVTGGFLGLTDTFSASVDVR